MSANYTVAFKLALPFESEQTLILAYNVDGSIVGTVTVRHERRRVADFSRLFVVEDRRLQGIGRSLLAKAVEVALLSNCEGLSCLVNRNNVEAQDFYKRLGFSLGYQFQDGDLLMHLPIIKDAVLIKDSDGEESK